MLRMFAYKGESLEEIKERYIYSPKKLRENVYEVIGKSVTDKFSIHVIEGGGKITPPNKNGTGNINGIEVKKGDRLFFNSDDEITAEGILKAVICC